MRPSPEDNLGLGAEFFVHGGNKWIITNPSSSSLLPLIILLLVVGGFAFVAYQIWVVVNDIGDATTKKMEKKNIVLTKDGVKVGVKQVNQEEYVDRTQGVLMKAWNMSSWPGYKSKIWNTEGENKRR